MRKMMIPAVLAMALGANLGCQSGQKEFNRHTFRYERVGPRKVFRPAAEAEPGTLEAMGQIPPAARQPVPSASAEREKAYQRTQIHRLYIGNALPEESEAGENFYFAQKAPADTLSDLLVILYPAQGPGGTERMRYLLYRSDSVREEALEMAVRLDVPVIALEPGQTLDTDQSSWDLALGLLYSSDYPRKLTPAVQARAISLLNQVVENPAADRRLRWASAILAGNLHMCFEPRDYISAGATFARASDFLPGNSYQAMVTRFHTIRLLLARNQQVAAKQLAGEALDYFQKWENTECYEYLRSLVTDGR